MKNFENELDEKLNTSGQLQVRDLVKGLAEDQVSMAWRSSLNEKLLQAAPVKRSAWSRILRPALGLAAAGALALTFVMQQPEAKGVISGGNSSALEARLMADHQQTIALVDLSGPGLSPDETNYVSSEPSTDYDSLEVDLSAL